jgi:hypothetical protein
MLKVGPDGLASVVPNDSDMVGSGLLASRPASGTAVGDIYRVADAGLGIDRDDYWTGSAWVTLTDLRDPQFQVAEGPVLITGSFLEVLPLADPFPTSEIWWTSAAKVTKMLEITTTYNANKTVNTEQVKVYHADGTLRKTVLDTYVYSGVFVSNATRTIT